MNVYSKFCPNVFLAKCEEKYEKGEVIEVTTKYGKENECIVFNLIYEKDGFYYYSIVRADGFNVHRNGRSKEQKDAECGQLRQSKRVMSITRNPIKIETSYHWENLSRSDTTAKEDIEK